MFATYLHILFYIIFQLVCVVIPSYTMLQLFNNNVVFYRLKSFVFYDVRTTFEIPLVKIELLSKTSLRCVTPISDMCYLG